MSPFHLANLIKSNVTYNCHAEMSYPLTISCLIPNERNTLEHSGTFSRRMNSTTAFSQTYVYDQFRQYSDKAMEENLGFQFRQGHKYFLLSLVKEGWRPIKPPIII
jgi:hypothetical protein